VRRAALAGLLALALVGAGCGGGGDDDDAPATSAAMPTAETAPTDAQTPPAEASSAGEPSTSSGAEGSAPVTTTTGDASSAASAAGGTPALEPVADGFDQPVMALSPPGDPRLFVVEQTGRIWIWQDGQKGAEPFLDVSDRIIAGGEQGLLGLAFAPDFAQSGRFVVNYTNSDGNARVMLYTAEGDRADSDSAVQLLDIDDPYPNHNGGNVLFGPDGLLWVGMGDGGSGGDPQDRAQDPSTLLGKMMRIDIDEPDAQPEIWALGLRTPWRYSFDPKTGDLWIGDVGQGNLEEIDHVPSTLPAGVNFGWRRYEGTQRYDDQPAPDDVVMPVAEYSHADGCSVTGGVVLRDGGPLDGQYVYGDYCSGKVWSLDADAAQPQPREITDELGGPLEGLTSFGQDGDGRTLLVLQDGRILALTSR
jgi:glucose/arabinose dehydrogenase